MEELKKQISSLEDVDREIDEVKQRIKLKEADLTEAFNVLPNKVLKLAVNPVTTAISSVIGGSLLLKTAGEIKKFLSGSANNNEKGKEQNQSNKKSFLINSIKNIGIAGLIKLAARAIRYI